MIGSAALTELDLILVDLDPGLRELTVRLPPGCLLTALSEPLPLQGWFPFMVNTTLFPVCRLKYENLTKSLLENLKILCSKNGEKLCF